MGRGDRRGALRLGLFYLTVYLSEVACLSHKPPDAAEQMRMVFSLVLSSAGFAILSSVMYLAIEPLARRRMPELMVGWARLLEGRFRDPRVGRDLLVGGAFGAAAAAAAHLAMAIPSVVPIPNQTTLGFPPIHGGGLLFVFMCEAVWNSVLISLLLFGLYWLLLLILRRRALAIPAFVLIVASGFMSAENPVIGIVLAITQGGLFSLVALRFGLLALVGFGLVMGTLRYVPLPLDPGVAYTAPTTIVLLALAAFFVYALRVSVGPRPLFKLALDE